MSGTLPAGHVLVVEDEPDIRMVIEAFLESEGYQVDTATNGREALDRLLQGAIANPDANPDPSPRARASQSQAQVILLDMRMPVMDGWEFCKQLSHLYPDHPPVVIMTAAADAEKRAQEVNADSWIGKPFQLDELLAAVRMFTQIAHKKAPPGSRLAGLKKMG